MRFRRTAPETSAVSPEENVDAAPFSAIGTVIGGYRILRKLGEGIAADVYLGHAGADTVDETASRSVALKVYRPGVDPLDVQREIGALTRAAHPHSVALRDLATLDSGVPCLVLERLERGSLARFLSSRSMISAGEAVTILAPVAAAVDAAHQSGVVHGHIVASSILFRESGAPVLACFGRSTSSSGSTNPAALASDPGVHRDRRALAALAMVVLAAVPESRGAPLADWLEQFAHMDEGAGYPDTFGVQLGERLFAMAAAAPLYFPLEHDGMTAVPSRLAAAADVASPMVAGAVERLDVTPHGSLPGWLAAAHVPAWVEEAAREFLDGSPIAVLRERLSRQLAAVRKPVWFLTACVAAAIIGTVALTSVAPSTSASTSADETPAADLSDSPDPPNAQASPTPFAESSEVLGDDPVAAMEVLLTARDRCLRDLSVLCLDDVLQSGSSAMSEDASLIRSLQDGAELPADAGIVVGTITLVERLGDSALLDLGTPVDSNPASALMIRGEAGWRIRSYLG